MKPEIICHMISSLDGRLQIERYSKLYQTENQDLALDIYLDLGRKIKSDAWMIGKGTVQSMGLTEVFVSETDSPAKDFSSYVDQKISDRYCVIFDSKGMIKFSNNTFEGDQIIVVLGQSVTEEYLNFLKDLGISYLFAGSNGTDIDLAMKILYRDFAIKRARLEGGGILNGTFLNAGAIDELSIVLYPGLDGLSGISSIFEYKGKEGDIPTTGQTLALKDVQKLEAGLLWLRYDIHKI
ncbi:dihydrofolate reductase family protein [Chryseobacterium sp. BIGb0232]|uniref:dihydrofolate reductase family protein n=1 Tax=Chryseobacterium sp. BIGb0232 TaxID=2940598 RepID=UPI000F4A918A|nr:dihydrofolate reductase family protein [Chryseobacterium sp. BIGb0232]MCS4302442.1 riboflavin biosynthesis pyrimidine reductase [Chryseobacterium sp. BIGb0232]ROS18384.1 riboflavin biosynthesis pyrimidine reductase [Chryseobacterium nakagawai]